jgi:hypothetical protein
MKQRGEQQDDKPWQFKKGREKTGGRQKGTPNHPISIKTAMRRFTEEKGGELLAWADDLMSTPDLVQVGDKVINMAPVKTQLFKIACEYGIGLPNKQVQDGGHHTLQIVLRNPLGTDPVALRLEREAEAARRELRAGGALPAQQPGVRDGVARPVGPRPMSALMKASGAMPKVIKDEEGNELEPVGDQDLGDDPAFDVPSQ